MKILPQHNATQDRIKQQPSNTATQYNAMEDRIKQQPS
jgi:uncharacterized protein YdcH (DUF465 family)